MVSLVHPDSVSFRLLQEGFWQLHPLQRYPPVWISSHEGTCQTDKRRKVGPKLFHPSTRVAEEHAKLPLRIKDKVKIYLFLLSSLLLLTLAYKCTYHLFLTTAGHTRT